MTGDGHKWNQQYYPHTLACTNYWTEILLTSTALRYYTSNTWDKTLLSLGKSHLNHITVIRGFSRFFLLLDLLEFFLTFLFSFQFFNFFFDFFNFFFVDFLDFFKKFLRLLLDTKIAQSDQKMHNKSFICPKGKKSPQPKAKALHRSKK